jgi:hypothetical protein
MILTGAADGRVAPKAAVGRKQGWRAGHRKEWGRFFHLNEGFDLSSIPAGQQYYRRMRSTPEDWTKPEM